MSKDQVAIIGGGPAGAAAAFHLALAGFSVTVIESQTFPRVKVCGEYISPAATDLLEAIIPADELCAAGARRVHDFVIEVGSAPILVANSTARLGPQSRAAPDTLLLEKASAAGAQLLQPASVQSVELPR